MPADFGRAAFPTHQPPSHATARVDAGASHACRDDVGRLWRIRVVEPRRRMPRARSRAPGTAVPAAPGQTSATRSSGASMIPVCRPRLPIRVAALAALALCAGVLTAILAGSSVSAHSSDSDLVPSNLAVALVDNRVTLSWDAPVLDAASVTGYEILRRRPKEGEGALLVLVADTGSTATTYVDPQRRPHHRIPGTAPQPRDRPQRRLLRSRRRHRQRGQLLPKRRYPAATR